MRKLFLFLFLFISFQKSKAQDFFPKTNYPSNSFSYPLKTKPSFAGNYGECRPNHFHSGLDFRTEQKENLPLYSIADGYVARVSISHTGFGNCVYINHPGGYTSVYAHCNAFFSTLAKYVESKQYENKSWESDIQFPPHLFPVKKGTFVALSGNTGASQAPHLHLEIRNTKTDKTLNGLLFFGKIVDSKAPVISRLALYDAHQSIYHQEPKIFNAISKGKYDEASSPLIQLNTSKAYCGIQANDYMENSLRLGIYRMQLIIDSTPAFGWQLNNIGYNETRYMNALGDIKNKMSKGYWIQLCHKLPNDKLEIYTDPLGKNGIIDLSDGAVHHIVIKVYDVKGNERAIYFKLQGNSNQNISSCQKKFEAGKKNTFQNAYISFDLAENLLYDDVCIDVKNTESSLPYSYFYQILNPGIPCHDFFTLKLKPKLSIPENVQNKLVVLYSNGSEKEAKEKKGKAAVYKNNWVEVQTRDFGNFEITTDTKAPNLSSNIKNGMLLKNGTLLRIGAEDDLSSVKKIEVLADGAWLCFARRRNNYYYKVDSHFPKEAKNISIKAWDENDNVQEIKYSINRQ